MSDILSTILATKAAEVSQRSLRLPLSTLQQQCESAGSTRGFVNAISRQIGLGNPAVISEIKKASPSKGVIRNNLNVADIASSYAQNGAACLSVLTDEIYFQGHDDFVHQAKSACLLPVIRKEFIIDPYQVYESRMIGADAILLIVAALGDNLLSELSTLALALNMDVLVEVHDQPELERALSLPCSLIGINNRNLRTFETSLDTTLELLKLIPDDRIVVTESGIHTRDDVALMRKHNVNAFLVGEAFMKANQPGKKLHQLFF
jgi:indole-3-glycerol phosphate synthase